MKLSPQRTLVFFTFLFLRLDAHAIVDSNSNGMSDVWERHFHGGSLFSAANPAHGPEADPDGDGWSNLHEAIAGTDPFNAQPPENGVPAALAPHPTADGGFMLSWLGEEGKVYRPMVSSGPGPWTELGPAIEGTGVILQLPLLPATGQPPPAQRFWRVNVEDMDPDEDTLATWEELKLGLNPEHADTDLDGVRDGTDVTPLVNNVIADPDGQGLPASLATGLVGRWDCEALTSYGSSIHGVSNAVGSDSPLVCGQTSLTLEPLGMISKGVVLNEARDYLTGPPGLVHGRASFSISLWFKLQVNSIQLRTNRMAFLTISEALDGQPDLMLTAYKGVAGSTSQKIIISRYAGGIAGDYLAGDVPQSKWMDDGKWHHLVLTKQNSNVKVYVNGELEASGDLGIGSFSMASNGYVCFGKFVPNAADTGTHLLGSLDRIRFYSRALSAAEALALANQDSDFDGRTDNAEVKTRVWTDANNNSKVDEGEITYQFSPYRWEPPGS